MDANAREQSRKKSEVKMNTDSRRYGLIKLEGACRRPICVNLRLGFKSDFGNERASSEMTETHNQSAVGRWFVPGDLDGYFALFFSGFPDLLLIVGLGSLCGFSSQFVTQRILPAAGAPTFVGQPLLPLPRPPPAPKTHRHGWTPLPFCLTTPTRL